MQDGDGKDGRENERRIEKRNRIQEYEAPASSEVEVGGGYLTSFYILLSFLFAFF